eukprot:3788123-Rhodomonas_salina.4
MKLGHTAMKLGTCEVRPEACALISSRSVGSRVPSTTTHSLSVPRNSAVPVASYNKPLGTDAYALLVPNATSWYRQTQPLRDNKQSMPARAVLRGLLEHNPTRAEVTAYAGTLRVASVTWLAAASPTPLRRRARCRTAPRPDRYRCTLVPSQYHKRHVVVRARTKSVPQKACGSARSYRVEIFVVWECKIVPSQYHRRDAVALTGTASVPAGPNQYSQHYYSTARPKVLRIGS